MLVSATIRGTLSAAAELLDGTLDVGLGHPDFPCPAGAIALEPTPAALHTVAAQRLPKDVDLRPAFLLGQSLRFAHYVRRERERAGSCGGHLCDLRLQPSIAQALPQVKG